MCSLLHYYFLKNCLELVIQHRVKEQNSKHRKKRRRMLQIKTLYFCKYIRTVIVQKIGQIRKAKHRNY
jgi:hypothetical protein